MEKRILFRLLSGLHSSIMTQIANDYRFDDGRWGPNTKMFVNAVGMHPDRLTNMYFAYVFVLRAIGKARPFLMVRGGLQCFHSAECAAQSCLPVRKAAYIEHISGPCIVGGNTNVVFCLRCGTLGHDVHCKATHIVRVLHASSPL